MHQTQVAEILPDHFRSRRLLDLLATQSKYIEEQARHHLETIVKEMCSALRLSISDQSVAALNSLRRAAALVRNDPGNDSLRRAPSNVNSAILAPGGLAPWQVKEVRAYVDRHLSKPLSTQDLASIACISPFHFSRAFKKSFGHSPHQYVLQRRIARAQSLMLDTKIPLAAIAINCGLVDQAHFGKVFRRLVGETPRAWRRARATG